MYADDFKPASIDTSQPAVIDIEQGNKVKVTVPHVEGSSTKQTVYCGSKLPSQKDFALIINRETGEFVLERLTYKLNLKRTRSEKTHDMKPSVAKHQKPTPVAGEPANHSAVPSSLPRTSTAKLQRQHTTKPSKIHGSGVDKKVKSSVKREILSASSSSDASSSSSSDHDDSKSTASSNSEDEQRQTASTRHSSTSLTVKSEANAHSTINVCDDLKLSDSSSDSD